MRKILFTAVALALLVGCSSSAGVPSGGGTATTSSSAPPTESASPTPSPTPTTDRDDLPSDVTTSVDGDAVTYTLASDELTLTLPRTWTEMRESSQAFPIAAVNPDESQRIVVGELGPARLAPDANRYRELLVEKLDVDDSEVAYIGERYAGDTVYPAYEIATMEYVAWIFLVTADERMFELTIMGDTYANGVEALAHIETLTNGD